MIGQAISIKNKKYNIIILAGGAGSRMGNASDFIPKALSKIGSKRAIDYIIERYSIVAHKFIIGVCYHSDLLKSYIKGNYSNLDIEFSEEKIGELINNAFSTLYCLDHADSRYGTIITFCDLIMIGNNIINDNTIYYADKNTKGIIGTFRHSIDADSGTDNIRFIEHLPTSINGNLKGVLGTFIIGNTILFKKVVYNSGATICNDLTWDFIRVYGDYKHLQVENCETVYEFGNENDLLELRKIWENA